MTIVLEKEIVERRCSHLEGQIDQLSLTIKKLRSTIVKLESLLSHSDGLEIPEDDSIPGYRL